MRRIALLLLAACGGTPDEGGACRVYPDRDGDGFGEPAGWVARCDAPEGFVLDAGDCDDGDAAVFPGAAEACDGVDQDCDGDVDEDPFDPPLVYADADGDGVGAGEGVVGAACAAGAGEALLAGDCDDADATAFPGAPEDCGDGADDDCDGAVDCPASITGTVLWGEDATGEALDAADLDGDGATDLLVADTPTETVWLVPGPITAEGSIAQLATARWEARVGTFAAGFDTDGDGAPEVATGTYLDGDPVVVAWSAGGDALGVLRFQDGLGPTSVDAGDADGDGHDDLLLGREDFSTYDSVPAAAWIARGPLDADAWVPFYADAVLDLSPCIGDTTASFPGDLDGDGLTEAMTMCAWDRSVRVFASPITGDLADGDALARLEASWAAGAGDVDGDGHADLLARAETHAARVFAGPIAGRLDSPVGSIQGAEGWDSIEAPSVRPGDADGDGRADVLLGEPQADTGERDAGGAWLYLGPVTGVRVDADLALHGPNGDAWSGSAVLLADLDGDGVDDLVAGAPNLWDGADFVGGVQLLLSGAR